MDNFKPMLCCSQRVSFDCITYPVYVSPKYDGVRGIVIDGQLIARSGKPIPNEHTKSLLAQPEYNWIDGELVVSDDFNKNQSAFMTVGEKPDFIWYVFDYFKDPQSPTQERLEKLYQLVEKFDKPYIKFCPQFLVSNATEASNIYNQCLQDGHEGIVLKSKSGIYKFGRSTLKEGCCLKMKPFNDSEGCIIDVIPSTKKKNGHVFMKNLKVLWKGKEILIGSGFTTKDRLMFFNNREMMKGRYIRFKFNSLTGNNVPRFPVYCGMRDIVDM